MAGPELSDQHVASLIAFITTYADMHGEFVYDDSDCYCFVAVKYDPERGFRQITSGPRDYVIYSDYELSPAQALDLLQPCMTERGWPFPA
mgnify:CR=1 FL=1